MIEVISNRLMEMEVEGLTGAGYGERSGDASEPAQWLSRAGVGDARHPETQEGQHIATVPHLRALQLMTILLGALRCLPRRSRRRKAGLRSCSQGLYFGMAG